jgi:uncharacterized protein (DUF2062 family)
VALGVVLGIGIGVFPVPLQTQDAMLAAVALRANGRRLPLRPG